MQAMQFNPDEFIPDQKALHVLTEHDARRLTIMPLSLSSCGSQLRVATSEPTNVLLRDEVRRLVPQSIAINYVSLNSVDINQALNKSYGINLSLDAILVELSDGDTDNPRVPNSPIIRLVDAIIQDAVVQRASDIHLSPGPQHVRVRYRIDGVLVDSACIDKMYWPAMLVHLKVQSEMDIAETRLPQDGQVSRLVCGVQTDFRVASFPLNTGENIVMRVLEHRRSHLRINEICTDSVQRKIMRNLISNPSGLVIVCGPTGSGKTTTLYSLMQSMDSSALNIMTLEDPIEFALRNIQQSRVRSDTAFGYAQGIRGLLRQDPDVLLVGEIRDSESCAMACRAAMTGHLVLTSVHADNSVGALSRLIELGASQRQLANVVRGVVAQRLLRLRCTACADKQTTTAASHACTACRGTRYHGRVAIFECLLMTDTLSTKLISGASESCLAEQAVADGTVLLQQSAQALVTYGKTTHDELVRVLGN